jgi:hypothetical protein
VAAIASTSALASAAYLLPGGSGNDEADEIDADRRIPRPTPSDLKLLPPDELELELKLDADANTNPALFLLPFLRSMGSPKHPNAAVSASGVAARYSVTAARGAASMKAVGGARRGPPAYAYGRRRDGDTDAEREDETRGDEAAEWWW